MKTARNATSVQNRGAQCSSLSSGPAKDRAGAFSHRRPVGLTACGAFCWDQRHTSPLKRICQAQFSAILLCLLLIVVVAGLTGCAQAPVDHDGRRAEKTPFDAKWAKVRASVEAARGLAYAPDAPGHDTWQTPDQTDDRGAGDCEDIAIWAMRDMTRRGVQNVRLVIGRWRGGLHAWLTIHGDHPTWLADPTAGVGPVVAAGADGYVPLYGFGACGPWAYGGAR